MADDVIRHEVTVPAVATRAFPVFTGDLARWWPRAYTWAGETLEAMDIEPREGGACLERGPHGFTCHWGRVLDWEPPHRLVFTWQIGGDRTPVPDPSKASEVEVAFEPAGENVTRVTLEHRHFARHGEGSDAYQRAMDSPMGWPYILDGYAAYLR